MDTLGNVKALTFDVFGTILNLGGSLLPSISKFLSEKGSSASLAAFRQQWRARQRIEQYQDTIIMLGHSGYLETVRRALVYTLRLNDIPSSSAEVKALMRAWQELTPFPEVVPALERLKAQYKLVVLSNGDPEYLDHLVANRIGWPFDSVISTSVVGVFKPHPAVYRRAAQILGLEVWQCMMVSSNSFDVMGARACGFRAAFVDRYGLPYEDTPYQPDVISRDFTELSEALL